MNIIRVFLLAALFQAGGMLRASPLPSGYGRLEFGSDTASLQNAFPAADNHRFVVRRHDRESLGGITVYHVRYKKGIVDSAKLYFIDNRFALAMEYYYPGEEYRQQAVDRLAARYGQFVGSGTSFWKRQDSLMIQIRLREKNAVTVVSHMHTGLARELRHATDYSREGKMGRIDRSLHLLKGRLDSLEQGK